ncbi:HDOD domain-containing protein [Pseudomonas sp. zbq_18]|uniref:HDOD domain-containing protein n=1 Tax=Pseudomonas sp. zbq_18 TaxID=3367251 RepID=UPI00370B860F
MHVMIVDDDPWLTGLLQQLVLNTRPTATIDCFGDLHSALSAWKLNSYQLVLADWNLPDGSGLSLLQSIRQQDQSPPLVMITGRADRDSVLAARPLGISAYITKPFEVPKVIACIDRLLPAVEAQTPQQPTPSDFLDHLAGLCAADLDLPLLSGIKDKLQQAYQGTPLDFRKLAEEWQRDPALCAYLISAANSPAYKVDGQPCNSLQEALIRLGGRTSLNLAIAQALRQACTSNDPILSSLIQEHLNAAERIAEQVIGLARQCGIDHGALHAAALLHRMGELSVLLQAQQWSAQGRSLDTTLIDKAISDYATSFAIALKAQWGLPMALRQLIGATYALPKTQVRREQVLMRLAAALFNNEPEETTERLKSLAGTA